VSPRPALTRRARRSERGATVFVVVLAITLLTAVGLFAAHSATVVDQAAGYARLARQTGYLAEYGTLAMASELGSGAGSLYLSEAESGKYDCPGTRELKAQFPGGIFPCLTVSSQRLAERIAAVSNGEQLMRDQTGDTPDRLGFAPTPASGIFGEFVVELGDVVPAPPQPGSSQPYKRVTTTTSATLRPPGAACAPGNATLAGQQSVRSHIIVPASVDGT